MEIKEKVIEIISNDIGIENLNSLLKETDDLVQLGMNSITFIKLVVLIENEFDMKFEDEALDSDYLSTLTDLCAYVEKRIVNA